jgi:hypothetical protein
VIISTFSKLISTVEVVEAFKKAKKEKEELSKLVASGGQPTSPV